MASDADVALIASTSDRDALADIYDRYANGLYELCRAVLGDAEAAADALHDTFVVAATRLTALRDPSRLKAWLGAIARHESLRRATRPTRALPEPAALPVWEALDSLPERERAVLVLSVRFGLEGADLAAAAGLPEKATAALLSRGKVQLASVLRTMLLLRQGREACAELAQLAPRRHAALDAAARARVARHAAGCTVCASTWNSTPAAVGELAASPVVGAPVALRHHVLHDPRLVGFSAPLGDGAWQADGFPPGEPAESRRWVFGSMAAAVAAVSAALLLVLVPGAGRGPSDASPPAPHANTTTSDVQDFAPWPTEPKTSTSVKRATTTTTKNLTTTTTIKLPIGAARPSGTATTATTAPPFTISTSAREATVACHGVLHVSATTVGGDAQQLFLSWRLGSSGGANNMSGSGHSWSGATSSLDAPGTWTWWVSDSLFGGGHRSATHTVNVTGPC